jgi:hypothetical protein
MADETNAGDNAGEGGAPGQPEALNADKIRSIVAGMIKSSQAKTSQDFGAALDAKLAEFAKTLSAASAVKPDGDAGDGEPKPKAKAGKEPSEAEVQLAAMQKELAALKDHNRKVESDRRKERQQAIERGAYSDLKQNLAGKVRAEALDAVADLVRGRGLISYDDQGNALMRVTVNNGYENEDAQLPIAEAIPHYLKSKEAALFLPPATPIQQSPRAKLPGARPDSGATGVSGAKSPAEAFEALGLGSLEDNL